MLNLNNAAVSEAPTQTRTLIPNGTVCRAIIAVKLGDMEIPEFGNGMWFKKSQTSQAKWMELEFTIVGGEHEMGASGIPLAKEIGLSTLRSIIESANNIDPSDMSETAMQRRNISGVNDLSGMEICAKVGIEKGTGGYDDQNRLMAAVTPNQKDFIPSGQAPMAQAPAAQPQQAAQPTSGAVPSWANK